MPDHVRAEEDARNAIAEAEDLGFRVQIEDVGCGLWNVFLRQGPEHPSPTSIVAWQKFIARDDIAAATVAMLATPAAESLNAYLAELER